MSDKEIIAALLKNISFHADKAKYWVEQGFDHYADKELALMNSDHAALVQIKTNA